MAIVHSFLRALSSERIYMHVVAGPKEGETKKPKTNARLLSICAGLLLMCFLA